MPQVPGVAGSRSRVPGRLPLLLLAAGATASALAITSQADVSLGAKDQAQRLSRSSFALDVAKGQLGPWRRLSVHRSSEIGFQQTQRSGSRVLRFADPPKKAAYAAVTTQFAPQTFVTGRAEVNLVRQHLRRGKVRSLVAVAGGDGTNYEAGFLRLKEGPTMWALWVRTPRGVVRDIRTGPFAHTGRWYDVKLQTSWGRRGARGALIVDGKVGARTPRRNLTGAAADRAIFGLGRVSKRTETGVLLVREATFATATPKDPEEAPASPAPGARPFNGTLPGVELLRADYETGDLSQWDGSQRVAQDRIQVGQSTIREGKYAARFEVRNGDNPIGYGDRAEVQVDTGEAEGDDRWYAWSTQAAANFPSYNTWQVVSQWHAKADGSPPVGFFAQNDTLVLRVHRHSGPGALISTEDIWTGPLRRGEWQDITLHIRWSGSDSTGFVELWIDGVQQTFDDGSTRRAIRTLYPGTGAYFKQGLYRQSGLSDTGIVFHDGFRMNAE